MLKFLATAFSAFILGALSVSWWDNRPAGFPSVHVWLFKWSAPDSLAARLNRVEPDLMQCRANGAAYDAALKLQNDAVSRLKAEGDAAAARADKAAHDLAGARAVADSRARSIMAQKPGPDLCKAAEAVLRGG